MAQIYGSIEYALGDSWYEVLVLTSLLLDHSDLSGCLFGVDNYANYVPLFADRGLPTDASVNVQVKLEELGDEARHQSWVSWTELVRIDWDERALGPDERINQYLLQEDKEVLQTKWLENAKWASVRLRLTEDPSATVVEGKVVFRRPTLSRKDALIDTEFPLILQIMGCLAERFGSEAVRMVVWFD